MGLALQGGEGIGDTYQSRAATPRHRRRLTLLSYLTTAGASMPQSGISQMKYSTKCATIRVSYTPIFGVFLS